MQPNIRESRDFSEASSDLTYILNKQNTCDLGGPYYKIHEGEMQHSLTASSIYGRMVTDAAYSKEC